MKYLKIYLTSFTVFLEILKKSSEKSSENDQSTGHFQSFFIFFFTPTPPPPPDPRPEKKNPVNQLIKKNLALLMHPHILALLCVYHKIFLRFKIYLFLFAYQCCLLITFANSLDSDHFVCLFCCFMSQVNSYDHGE